MFPEPWAAYIIPDDSFRMRVEVAATDIVGIKKGAVSFHSSFFVMGGGDSSTPAAPPLRMTC